MLEDGTIVVTYGQETRGNTRSLVDPVTAGDILLECPLRQTVGELANFGYLETGSHKKLDQPLVICILRPSLLRVSSSILLEWHGDTAIYVYALPPGDGTISNSGDDLGNFGERYDRLGAIRSK
jgi:hypothetical protein